MEGRWTAGLKQNKIEMVRDNETKCYYCVVAGLSGEDIKNVKLSKGL